nr:hypothetical protein [Actinomycetales bacterium]
MLPADTAPEPAPALAWERTINAAEGAQNPLLRGTRLLVVSAHPDDETIGAGRLIAAHDGPVQCVTLTAGERCFGEMSDQESVAAERLAEWEAALIIMGAEPIETPRWPDGELGAHVSEAAAALSEAASEADVILAPWEHDPHPDHEAAARIARHAGAAAGIRTLNYVVWTPYWMYPAEVAARGALIVPVETDVRSEATWRRALESFRSQTAPRPPAKRALVPPELISRHATQLLVEGAGSAHA